MAGVFAVVGKLGTGKTKFGVWRAQQALRECRRVASNVDLNLEHLAPSLRASYVRVPDKPTRFDLEALGPGSIGKYDEDTFGVLLLDELGTWLNARSFQDKERAGLLDWLIHARKHRWEVYLFVQGANMIDKQVREDLIEYTANCMRLDKVKIPFVGKFINELGLALRGPKGKRWGCLPRMHLVTARVGQGPSAIVAERWMYRGDHLHAGYDTEQVFRPDYPHGSYTVLPRRDWRPAPGLTHRVAAWCRALLQAPPPPPRPALPAPSRLVQLLRQLPPDEALRHFQRLTAKGLYAAAVNPPALSALAR